MKRVIIKFLSILSLLFIFCSFICSIQKNTCYSNDNYNLSTSLNNTKSEEKQTQKVDKKQEEGNDNKKPKLSGSYEKDWIGTYTYGQSPGWVTIYQTRRLIETCSAYPSSQLPIGFKVEYNGGGNIDIIWSSSANLGTYDFFVFAGDFTGGGLEIACTLTIQYATPTGFRYPSDQHRINGSSFNVSASFSNYRDISPSNNQFTWSVNDPSILSFSTTSTTSVWWWR